MGMRQTIQAKRLRESLNKHGVTRYGERFTKTIYTPKKRGCYATITVHADELTREQIEGLKADLGYVDIYNDKTCHFSIIKYA